MKSLHNIISESIFDIDIDLTIYKTWLENNTSLSSSKLIDKIKFNTKGEIEWPMDSIGLNIKDPIPEALKFADNKKLEISCNLDLNEPEIDLDFLPNSFKKLIIDIYKSVKMTFSSKHNIPKVYIEQNIFDINAFIGFDFKKLSCSYFSLWTGDIYMNINELKWPAISKQCKLNASIIEQYWKSDTVLKLDVPEIKLINI